MSWSSKEKELARLIKWLENKTKLFYVDRIEKSSQTTACTHCGLSRFIETFEYITCSDKIDSILIEINKNITVSFWDADTFNICTVMYTDCFEEEAEAQAECKKRNKDLNKNSGR